MAFSLFKRIDQVDRGEEPDLLAVMLDGLDTPRAVATCVFAGSRATDQHYIMGAVDKVAAMELADHSFVHFAGSEVEAGQILVGGEPGRLDLVGDGPDLAFGDLGLEQLGHDGDCRIERRRALFDEIADRLGHAIHLERRAA